MMPQQLLEHGGGVWVLIFLGMLVSLLIVIIWQGLKTLQVRMTTMVQVARDVSPSYFLPRLS